MGTSTIYTRQYNSENVKFYIKKARLLRLSDRTVRFSLEQQFSDLVTDPQNLAKIKRQELVNDSTIVSGFIEYPARLMVKYKGEKTINCMRTSSLTP